MGAPRAIFRRWHRCLVLSAACGLASSGVTAADGDLFELSLEELLDVEVTSVSKKAQPVSQAAAAIFVITAQDIRRAGVTSIPEALRMAPGVEVAQIDGNKWSIGTRGFQTRFSTKLLVLMDGRTLYSPVYSGVFWDVQDTLIEDIDRIEVIRGPGATLWGANAVNGVINIITRDAADTTGGLLGGAAGIQERGYAALRYGGELGELGHYRVYGKHFERDSNRIEETGADAADTSEQTRVGFRADLTLGDSNALTLQGDLYTGESGESVQDLLLTPPYRDVREDVTDLDGFNVLARWQSSPVEGDTFSAQMFIDSARRAWHLLDIDRTITDLDVDYRTERFPGHDLLLGFNYRMTRDRLQQGDRVVMDPESREEEVFGAFIQDEIQLVPERLSLIAGLKLEYNDYTGVEYQPNLRLLWTPDERRSFWASVTRAVRTPGRADRDSRLLAELLPPRPLAPLAIGVYAEGNRDFQAERVIAWEAGFKYRVSETLSSDLALFYNDHQNTRAVTLPDVSGCLPQGLLPECLAFPDTRGLIITATQENAGEVTSYGLEWVGTWRPAADLDLTATYSFLNEKPEAPDTHTLIQLGDREGRHGASLRLGYRPSEQVDVGLWLRYADEVQLYAVFVEAYTTADARVAWRFAPNAELALVGRNLLDSAREQFYSELNDVPLIQIERSLFLQLSYEF